MVADLCTVADVEAELNVSTGYFTESTTPTLSQVETWIEGESEYIETISRHPLETSEETLILDQEISGRYVYCKNGYLVSVSEVEVNEGTEFAPSWTAVSSSYIHNNREGIIKVDADILAGYRKVRVTGVFGKTNLLPVAKMLCIHRVVGRSLRAVASKQVFDNPVDIDIAVISVKFRPGSISQYTRYYDEQISRLEARLEEDSFTSMLI